MGGSSYSYSNRSIRAEQSNFASASLDSIFEQNVVGEIHPEMNPRGVTLREARDSDIHPESFPIILGLDVTGSMGTIPEFLVRKTLPELVQGIIDAGLPSPAIMFMAIGDHINDRAPLQISQFESGDEELDMWLTRVWLEGHGGGNNGESYPLVWDFAHRVCVTDHWEKRGKKGIIITVGDEPSHSTYPSSALAQITGNGDIATFTDKEALERVQEKWRVFHILPGTESWNGKAYWNELLGDNAIWAESKESVAQTIKEIVINTCDVDGCLNHIESMVADTDSESKTVEKPGDIELF